MRTLGGSRVDTDGDAATPYSSTEEADPTAAAAAAGGGGGGNAVPRPPNANERCVFIGARADPVREEEEVVEEEGEAL